MAQIRSAPRSATARPSSVSVFRPPRPAGPLPIVTVVSPPDSSTQGAGRGWPWLRTERAMPASTMPSSRLSPSSASPRMTGVTPARDASAAAAASAMAGVAIMRTSTGPAAGGRFSSPASSAAAAGGSTTPYCITIARTPARDGVPGTVSPLAMVPGSSPGTSLITSVTTRAGYAAAASRPPLMADRCLRTAFITPIGAPHASRDAFTACLSASVMPGPGSAARAEPPPEISASTRSSGPNPATSASSARAPASLFASGTGWLASITRICRVGAPWPYRVTTVPRRGHVRPRRLQRRRHRGRGLARPHHHAPPGPAWPADAPPAPPPDPPRARQPRTAR